MLVLTRKRNEAIVIGDATVVVIDIRGDRVRLGVDAPKETPVYRRELYEAIKRAEDQGCNPPESN